jgi:hypothetical protein
MKTLGINDINVAFAKFASELETTRGEALKRIAVCGNGFEGWLKFEFFMWLCNSGLAPHEHVGLEYKVALNAVSTLGPSKQCDLWVLADTADRYHYVEIKAPFANKTRPRCFGTPARMCGTCRS